MSEIPSGMPIPYRLALPVIPPPPRMSYPFPGGEVLAVTGDQPQLSTLLDTDVAEQLRLIRASLTAADEYAPVSLARSRVHLRQATEHFERLALLLAGTHSRYADTLPAPADEDEAAPCDHCGSSTGQRSSVTYDAAVDGYGELVTEERCSECMR